MDADSAKCMKSMNISSIGERKLRFHNLPPTVCRKIDSHRTITFSKNFSKGGLEMELSTILIPEG